MKNGFEAEFDPPLPARYRCGACALAVRDAHETPVSYDPVCGHLFCAECIEAILARPDDEHVCPEDGTPIEMAKPTSFVARKVMALSVKCSNHQFGCPETMVLAELEEHMETCGFEGTQCPDCDADMPRYKLDAHLVDECPKRELLCPWCAAPCPADELDGHKALCDTRPVACPRLRWVQLTDDTGTRRPAGYSRGRPEAGFSSRYGHGVVEFDGHLIACGGVGVDGKCVNDVWSSANGLDWRRLTEAAEWKPRSNFALVVYGGAITLLGGVGANGKRYSDVWTSPDGGSRWQRRCMRAGWRGRSNHAALVIGAARSAAEAAMHDAGDGGGDDDGEGEGDGGGGGVGIAGGGAKGALFVMGGYTDEFAPSNDVWKCVDGVGTRWEQVAGSGKRWAPRFGHAVALMDRRLYLVGGLSQQLGDYHATFGDTWSTLDGENWELMSAGEPKVPKFTTRTDLGGGAPAPDLGSEEFWRPRSSCTLVVYHRKLLLCGGVAEGSQRLSDTWRSTDGVTWSRLPTAGWSARYGHRAVQFGGGVVLVGGYDHGLNYHSDLWRADEDESDVEWQHHRFCICCLPPPLEDEEEKGEDRSSGGESESERADDDDDEKKDDDDDGGSGGADIAVIHD